MPDTIQSLSGQKILSVLLELFQENGNIMSKSEVYDALETRSQWALDATDRQTVSDILDAYTGQTIACTSENDQVLCLFVSLDDDQYELIADPETVDAVSGREDARVSAAAIPADGDQMVHFHAGQDDFDLQSAMMNPAADPSAQDIQNGLGEPEVYGDDVYDTLDDIEVQSRAQATDFDEDMTGVQAVASIGEDLQTQTSSEYANSMTPGIQAELDAANQAVLDACARAESAEKDAEETRAQMESLRQENSSYDAEGRISMKEDAYSRKTQRKIRRAADVIEQQKRKIADQQREAERGDGRNASMVDAQIRHDRKIIDRKVRKIANLEANA